MTSRKTIKKSYFFTLLCNAVRQSVDRLEHYMITVVYAGGTN